MKYIGYYDTVQNRRLMSPAAVNKMDYIAGIIAKVTGHTEIIACGMHASEKIKKNTVLKSESVSIYYFDTKLKHFSWLGRRIERLSEYISLLYYLIKKVKRNETIVVYHSLLNMKPILLAKKIKGFKVILEVEEFYNDVGNLKKDTQKYESKYISSADMYLFPTSIMDKMFNKDNKPSVIVHGIYKRRNINSAKFEDGKVHIVYAGTFDPKKGGAIAAIRSSKYLGKDYILHILGFGNEEDTDEILRLVAERNETGKCEVRYEGLMIGEDYERFLSKCDIGLSTQNPDGEFNNTSFPSKILSYMCNGLRVVSVRIPAVEESKVVDAVVFFEGYNPAEIAAAIEKAAKLAINPKEILRKLDKDFYEGMRNLINGDE